MMRQTSSEIPHERAMAITDHLEPGKRGGRPCIRGMRITVYDVLSHLAAGMTVAEILDDFPHLTPDDIQACLAYATERDV